MREVGQSLTAVVLPRTTSARPRTAARTPSILDTDRIKIDVYRDRAESFHIYYFNNEPFTFDKDDSYEINYVSFSIQPYHTFGSGNKPRDLSILVRIFLKETIPQPAPEPPMTLNKQVLLNHIISHDTEKNKLHFFYDSSMHPHDKKYEKLKYLAVKYWLDAREFLRRECHDIQSASKCTPIKKYTETHDPPLTSGEEGLLVKHLLNEDPKTIKVKEEKMIITEDAERLQKKSFVNYIDFLKYDGTTSDSPVIKRARRSGGGAKPAAPTAKQAKQAKPAKAKPEKTAEKKPAKQPKKPSRAAK
jgi:hypothetical protein